MFENVVVVRVTQNYLLTLGKLSDILALLGQKTHTHDSETQRNA
jgi:hypothetical protein